MTSILVRAPNWIGDQVLAYPFFVYLRKAYPSAHITSVCVPWVESIQFTDLVDDVVVLHHRSTSTWKEKLKELERVSKHLRNSRKWDLGFSLPNSLSAAWLLFRSRVRNRIGYATEGRSILLNKSVPWDANPNRHRAQAYVDLLPSQNRPERGIEAFWGEEPENELDAFIPGEKDRFDALVSWKKTRFLEPPTQEYWVLAPGASADSRRWPLERFASLARQVKQKTGWKALIVGGPTEKELAQILMRHEDSGFEDWTARGSVAALGKIFAQAQFTVTNESGLAHVASLCGSPVQIVCGAANPNRTAPIGPGKVRVTVNPAVDCWPCEKNICRFVDERKIQCLKGIQADSIWEEIEGGFLKKRNRNLH